MKQRLLYPDICKFLAIFLVTWSHSAQCVSGEIWTNIFGGKQLDISFNMPLFMMISGWFLNIDKMRKTKVLDFAVSKFKRLMIPAFTWYFLYLILSLKLPEVTMLCFYWYLTALFLCLCTILLFSKLFKSNTLCCLLSIALILLLPKTDYANMNFMFPFIWAGYGLRQLFATKKTTPFVIICAIIGLCLCFGWDRSYTVYLAPFQILHTNREMLFAYIYRFAIGFTLSAVCIFLIKKYEQQLQTLAPLGTYSLVIYTSSMVLLKCVSKILDYFQFHTNAYVLIDVLSLGLCTLIVCLIILFSFFCRRHKVIKMLFLGE